MCIEQHQVLLIASAAGAAHSSLLAWIHDAHLATTCLTIASCASCGYILGDGLVAASIIVHMKAGLLSDKRAVDLPELLDNLVTASG